VPEITHAASAAPRNRKLLSVAQFCRDHEELTESALRWLIHASKPRHHAHSLTKPNGFDMVIVRRGRRVFLDCDKYDEWLDMQQDGLNHVRA